MNRSAEVYLWGTRIGIIYLRNGNTFLSFEYDKDFVRNVSGTGIEVSPIMMPVSGRVYEFPELGESFRGAPGLIADSLPDKFGNAVIRNWLASIGKSESEFNVIDRLCYTGSRGMGALEYVPANGPELKDSASVDVSEMVKFASDVLNNRSEITLNTRDNVTYSQLLKLGTSAGGARAKAIVAWNESTGEVRSGQINAGDGFDYWIIKFDGVGKNGDHGLEDEPEYTLIEYAYYLMAQKAGIDMMKCRIFSENGRNHFMTKRFDRIEGDKLHVQTLSALAHIDYNIPGLCSYEAASSYLRQIGVGQSGIEEFFRRMVFNVLSVNQDDHVKNISAVMDRRGNWKLSPAYDLTFSYNLSNVWLKAHQMTVNGKSSGISKDDITECGKRMGISTRKINSIISEVSGAVECFDDIAKEVGVRKETIKTISSVMEKAKL